MYAPFDFTYVNYRFSIPFTFYSIPPQTIAPYLKPPMSSTIDQFVPLSLPLDTSIQSCLYQQIHEDLPIVPLSLPLDTSVQSCLYQQIHEDLPIIPLPSSDPSHFLQHSMNPPFHSTTSSSSDITEINYEHT